MGAQKTLSKEEFEAFLKKEKADYILDSGIPMILVPAESYEEDAAVWNEKIAASGYVRSHGIRAVYKKEKEKTDG